MVGKQDALLGRLRENDSLRKFPDESFFPNPGKPGEIISTTDGKVYVYSNDVDDYIRLADENDLGDYLDKSTYDPTGGNKQVAFEEDVKKYAGFENRTDSTIAMNGNNFEITTATNYGIWINGAGKQTVTDTYSIEITDDQTITYVYFNITGGVLTINKSTTPWNIASGHDIPIAIIFKDGSIYALTDERHGYNRNLDRHSWAHLTIGAMYKSGLTGNFLDTTFSIASGIIYDEDIRFETGGTKTTTSLWYRNATNGMRLVRGSTTPYSYIGATAQRDNGSGILQNVGNNNFYTSWVYCSNDPFEPIYTVIGQGNHANLNDARAEGQPIINLSTAERKLLYKVIYRNTPTPTFIEAVDYRTVQTGAPTNNATPNSHTSLIDRGANDSHPISAITDLQSELDSRTAYYYYELDQADSTYYYFGYLMVGGDKRRIRRVHKTTYAVGWAVGDIDYADYWLNRELLDYNPTL